MKVVAFLVCAALLALFYIATGDLPDWGDPNSPANSYLSTYYLENSVKQTATPNVVTAILADYRGFDTMLELTVILIAGLAVLLIMAIPSHVSPLAKNLDEHDAIDLFSEKQSSLIVRTTTQLLVPFTVIFALYVLAHGHYSPGGGFQAGVILGAVFILGSFSHGIEHVRLVFSEKLQAVLIAAGVLIYSGTGLLSFVASRKFLDYEVLADIFAMPEAEARALAILIVESGVTVTVMSSMFMIFNRLAKAVKIDT